jgi:hypothetical protein
MGSASESVPSSASGPEGVLQRILQIVEKSQRKSWVEVACAIILSLATTSSAWCAYQSKLWAEAQGLRNGSSGAAAAKAAQDRILAVEIRALESSLFVKYYEAKIAGNEPLANFYAGRLYPNTRAVLDAWWKTNPLQNPDAPRSPFDMKDYKQRQLDDAKQMDQQATALAAASSEAGQNSDTYVLLTVMFASVLFFGGIASTFASRPLHWIMFFMALCLLTVTFVGLLRMPIFKS